MTTPWAEQMFEDLVEPANEHPFGELEHTASEGEWDSPFAAVAARESFDEFEAPTEEGLTLDGAESEWGSPFEAASPTGEQEILVGPNEFPSSCGDVTMDGKKWPFGIDPRSPQAQANLGEVSSLTHVPRAEVFEFHLSKYDVDRHELKRSHKDAIADFTKRVKAGLQSGKYANEPLRVFTYGEASSTGSSEHNAALSRNRAFNAMNAIRCEFKNAGITVPVYFGFYGTGEQHARFRGPDNLETPSFRGVVVRAFAPLREPKPCNCPPVPKPPTPGKGTAICVSVPHIAPRTTAKLPPDVIPLGAIIPGLRLPIAIVTKAEATVRVDAGRGQMGQLAFRGWGLEVALPTGRARIDLQADLRASLEVLARASASLSAKLRLGPLGLILKIDASAFAQLVVKLAAQLRLRIDVGLGRPNLPELTRCRPVGARNVRGSFPFPALAGPALLIVPGQGYGPAVLSLQGPGVAGLGLAETTLPVPADKRTVRTLLALGGNLQPAGGVRREAEFEWPEAEWPEAFEPAESEMPSYA